MHYRDGKEAQVGDVLEYLDYSKIRHLAIVMSISPGSTTCDASVAKLVSSAPSPRGFVLMTRRHEPHQTVTLGKCDLVKRMSVPTDLPPN